MMFSSSAPAAPGVCAAIARRSTSGAELHLPRVHLKDLDASVQVGTVDHDEPVEASRTHQRLIQHLGTVRRRHDDHVGTRIEAVHLGEQLVERLLALVVSADRDAQRTATSRSCRARR